MSSVYHKPPDEFVTRITTAAPVADNDVQDDDEYDEEDRQARRREVQQELERSGTEERANGVGSRAPASGGGGGGGLDLLDLDGGGDDMVPSGPTMPQKMPLLMSTAPGQNGKTGFGVMAVLARQNGISQLMVTFSNASSVPLTGFAIQVNKNPFGFGPATALQVPDIMPGSAADSTLIMQPNQLLSNTAPTNPLFLQVAIKNSLDIFYFNVPFDLPVALSEAPALGRDQFSEIWQRVGEGRQHSIDLNAVGSLSVDSVRSRLALDNVQYVAQRQSPDGNLTYMYTSATTTNNCAILAEVWVSNQNSIVKLVTRTETPVLVPLFEAAVSKRLTTR